MGADGRAGDPPRADAAGDAETPAGSGSTRRQGLRSVPERLRRATPGSRYARQLREVSDRYRTSRSRQQVVSAVTSAVAGASTQAEVAQQALGALAQHLPVAAATVRLVDRSRRRWCRLAEHGMPVAERSWATFDAQPWTPIHEVIDSGRRVVVPTWRAMSEQFPDVADAVAHVGFSSLVCVALPPQREELAAVLSLSLSTSDSAVLRLVAQALDDCAPIIGQALERARLFEFQSKVASDLQHALLPRNVPYDDRIDVAVRYVPAIEALEVGGDWYDVVALDNDRVALIVGDAVGHGLAAATVMGRLSSAVAALVAALDDPGLALEHLDALAERTPGADCTTCLVVVIDPAHEVMCVSSAGHVPPVLLHEGGVVEILEDAQGPPLGVGHLGHRSSHEHRFPVGATLVLCTDGLVERRGESLDAGLQRLCAVAAAGHREGEDATVLGDRLVTSLVGRERHDDDVALITTRLVRTHSSTFTRRLGRDPSQLRPLRHDLDAWLSGWLRVPEDARDGIVLAVSEATANAMEHAYAHDHSGQPPMVRVDAVSRGNSVSVRIRDRGAWREKTRDASRGRGLLLMRSLADAVQVEHRDDGTDVTLEWRLDSEAEVSPRELERA